MVSLRERRRVQTAAAIRRAAVDLAHHHGLDHITTEMISDAAGISPRTFFNYFPFKEAALVPQPSALVDTDKVEFVQGKGKLLSDLANLLAPMLSDFADDRDTMCKAHEISLNAPKLLALHNALFMEFEQMIAGLLAERLVRNAGDIDLRHMAAVVAATVRMGFAAWVEAETLSLDQAVRQRLLALSGLFALERTYAPVG